MDQHTSATRTRRDFLLSSGIFAAGVLGAPAVSLAQQEQAPTTSPNKPKVAEPIRPPQTVPGVTTSSFFEAEKLAGIEFTDDERQMLATSIGEQLNLFQQRQKHGTPPNSLAPAQVFDPRLPETRHSTLENAARSQKAIVRNDVDPGPLPA